MRQISFFTAVVSTLAAIIVAGFFVVSFAQAAGCTPFFVASGGTGNCNFISGRVPFGNGTSPIASSTNFIWTDSANRLSFTYGSTTAISGTNSYFTTASSTNLIISSAGSSGTKCLQVAADGTVSSAAAACATGGTPGGSQGQVQYNGGGGSFAGVSTSSIAAASVISVTNGSTAFVIGAQPTITTTGGTFGAGNYTFPTDLTVTGNATTTALFATTASTTRTFGSNLQTCSGTSALTYTGTTGLFGCAAVPQGTVTSITAGSGLNGGTINNSGTISLISYIATSTGETSGRIPVWTSTGATPATLSGGFSGYTLTSLLLSATNASTTQLTVATGLQIPNSSNPASLQTGYVAQSTNTPFQLRAGSAVFDPRTALTVGISTTTAWIGTSSVTALPVLTIPTALTWNSISCTVQPSGATLEAQYEYANSTAYTTVNTFLLASSTPGVFVLSSNNTPTTNATSTIVFGNPTGSPTSASCTLVGTITGI